MGLFPKKVHSSKQAVHSRAAKRREIWAEGNACRAEEGSKKRRKLAGQTLHYHISKTDVSTPHFTDVESEAYRSALTCPRQQLKVGLYNSSPRRKQEEARDSMEKRRTQRR